jgi:hypothetical protein
MMFACQFDNNLFALVLFEGIRHSNSKDESISLQQATLGVVTVRTDLTVFFSH